MSQVFALSSLASLLSFGLLLQTWTCFSQNFDPNVDDKDYLDTIQKRLHMEAMDAHYVLINQTMILQQVTRTFIETKIKENLFKVVRERVEMELEEMARNGTSETPISNSSSLPRQSRQDEEDDDDSARTTARPRPGLLPQLANVVTTLFGSDVNVTGYLKDATSFLPFDLSDRIVNAASLIDPNRFTSTTTPLPLIINGQVIPQRVLINGTEYEINQVATPVLQSANFVQQQGQGLGAEYLSPQSQPINAEFLSPQPINAEFLSPQPINADNLNLYPQSVASGQLAAQSRPALVTHAGGVAGASGDGQYQQQQQQQQQSINNGGVHPIASPLTLGDPIRIQESNNNLGKDALQPQISPQTVVFNPVPNFKVNAAIVRPTPPSTSPSSSNEDDEDENNSAEKTVPETKNPQQNEEDSVEDDLPIARDDTGSTVPQYLDEYPVVKYGLRFFQRFTMGQSVPTTTEFVPSTTENLNATLNVNGTMDYLDEEEVKAPATPPPSTYQQVVQGGIALYEGAKEAYNFLQQINKFLDRVNIRLENAGYGAEEVGIELDA